MTARPCGLASIRTIRGGSEKVRQHGERRQDHVGAQEVR